MRLTATEAKTKSTASSSNYDKYVDDILVWVEDHAKMRLLEFSTPLKDTFVDADVSKNQTAIDFIKITLENLGYRVSYNSSDTRLLIEWK